MNLLVLGPYDETTSGPSRVLTEVVSNLSDDIRVMVLSPKKRREHTRVDRDIANVSVRFQSCGQIPKVPISNQWVEAIRMNRRLQTLDFDPDLVWTHSATLHAACRFSKFRAVPSVSTVHGVFGGFYRMESHQRLGGMMTAMLAKQNMSLQKHEFSTATTLTTYSEYLKELILRVAPHARVALIPNGVSTARFRVSAAPRGKIIVYVGRMAKIKGVHILIESMKEVVRNNDDWSLWLVGGAFDQPRSFFESFMTPETSPHIKFLGQIPNEDVPAILSNAGIFVMPTLRDGFEIAMMEAMATGIPCVTTAAFERVELYGGYAETVPPNDSKALGQKLNLMIRNYSDFTDDAAVQKRTSRAREFDWAAVAGRYEQLFREYAKCQG